MSKLQLPGFIKLLISIILVFLQFFLIVLHFIQLEFIPKIEIMPVNYSFSFIGYFIIIIALIVMIKAIKDLGSNLSPLPKPVSNGSLITSGIYSFVGHPIYYSLIFISFGIFIINFTFYYLCLTISLALVIKFKIILEEHYLNNKFKHYFIYKGRVKF